MLIHDIMPPGLKNYIGGTFLMKRMFAVLVAFILSIMMITTCVAEEAIIDATNETTYYVVRPHVKFVLENDENSTLSFGDKVIITDQKDNYAFIESEDGQKGRVTIGFIVPSNYPIIWLDEVGCFISPTPGLTSSDFGYGACGQRYEERAIILFEEEGYFFIVTDEGFSGYILKNDPHISLYTGQIPSGT